MSNGINPMQLLGMIKNGSNPQQLMLSILEQNPNMKTLTDLAKANNISGIENFVRNYVNSQGGDFDKDFNAFKQMLGVK